MSRFSLNRLRKATREFFRRESGVAFLAPRTTAVNVAHQMILVCGRFELELLTIQSPE